MNKETRVGYVTIDMICDELRLVICQKHEQKDYSNYSEYIKKYLELKQYFETGVTSGR